MYLHGCIKVYLAVTSQACGFVYPNLLIYMYTHKPVKQFARTKLYISSKIRKVSRIYLMDGPLKSLKQSFYEMRMFKYNSGKQSLIMRLIVN